MTPADARAKAYEVIADAEARNASYEHPESKKRAELAAIIIDLSSQIDAKDQIIAELRAK